jgi:hypothetical protein
MRRRHGRRAGPLACGAATGASDGSQTSVMPAIKPKWRDGESHGLVFAHDEQKPARIAQRPADC